MIRTSDIRIDGGTQARAAIDQATVDEYAEAMADPNTVFPPISAYYDGKDYWLADGFHRLAAWVKIGREEVPADVRQGDRRRAILHSVAANSAHGLRRSNADKRRAVMTLLEDEEWSQWSNRDIAKRCGVSHVFVANLRREIEPEASSDGAPEGGNGYHPEPIPSETTTCDPALSAAEGHGQAVGVGGATPRAVDATDHGGRDSRDRPAPLPAPAQPEAAPPSEPAADAPPAEPDPHAKLRAEFRRLTPQAQEDDWIGLREALAEEKAKRKAAETAGRELKARLNEYLAASDSAEVISRLEAKIKHLQSEMYRANEDARVKTVAARKAQDEAKALRRKLEAQEVEI